MNKKKISVEVVAARILVIRGTRVMLDSDLASLYGVKTKNLNLQVKRNIGRFPGDFMFQLTKEEVLRLQNATSKRGGRRYLPHVFIHENRGAGYAGISQGAGNRNILTWFLCII